MIIDFPLTNSESKTFKQYKEAKEYAVNKGAKNYTALECYENKNSNLSNYC